MIPANQNKGLVDNLSKAKKLYSGGKPEDAMKQALEHRKQRLQSMKADMSDGPVLK